MWCTHFGEKRWMKIEEEQEVYGGEIPDEAEMEGDLDPNNVDMSVADDDAIKEFDEMTKRLKEMEEEAAALREVQAKVEEEIGAVKGFVQCGKPKEAIDLYAEMEEMGSRPNEATVVAFLAFCADLGGLDLGRKIHEYSEEDMPIISNAVVWAGALVVKASRSTNIYFQPII